MELQITKDEVLKKSVRYMGVTEETVETVVNLPDYCAEINKAVNTSVTSNVNSVWVNSGKIVVDGNAVFRILYTSDSGKCEVYETNVPFSKKIDIPGAAETDCVSVTACCEQTSCRVSGPRCAELKCSIALDIRDEYIDKNEIVSSCTQSGVMKLEQTFTKKALTACAVNTFTVSDSFDSRNGSDVKIYRTDVTACINEYKCIKNKMMLKGIYLLKIITLNDDGDLCTQNESIQFSQIFDIDTLDENSECRNRLKVCSVNVSFSSDRTLQKGRFEISVTSVVNTDVYNDVLIRCIEDAFSPEYELSLSKGEIRCCELISEPSQLFRTSVKIDMSAYPDAEIADICVRKIKYTSMISDGSWNVSGNIFFDIILKMPDSGYIFTQRAEDFSFSKPVDIDPAGVSCESEMYINNMAFSPDSDSSLAVDIEFNVSFIGVKNTDYKVVTDMSVGAVSAEKNDSCFLNVYFAEKGESVWSIAKSHKADPVQIKELNSLDSDILDDKKTLIFSV